MTSARHRLEVHSGGALTPLQLTLDLEPFHALVLDVRAEGPALVAVVAGASSPQCVGLTPGASVDAVAAPDDVARALARGDCPRAFELLRHLGEGAPRARLLQVAWSLTGRSQPRSPPSGAWAVALQRRTVEEAGERAWLVSRWDALTELLSRATRQLAPAATGVLTASNERMEALSDAFSDATTRGDLEAQRAVVRSAEQVLRTLADELVALRPTDCDWRTAVQRALESGV